MKKTVLFLSSLAVIIAAGCTKDPEIQPLDQLTGDYVFDSTDITGAYAEQFLNNIYTSIPAGFNRIENNLLDAGTDDAMPSENGSTVENFTDGRISPFANPDNPWSRYYSGIRDANIFLSRVDRVPVAAQTKTYWKADARFLRALFYFEMIKCYGGVPVIGDTVYNLTDDIQPARNTFEACVNYIVSECDAISGLERPDPVSTTDWGRISKGVVLTLKAKVLLYAASPLFNGVEGASGEQAGLQGYPTYDAERWNKAAQAAKDVMDLNAYSLDASYSDVFLSRRNKEVILSHLRPTTNDIETNNGPVGYANLAGGQGRTSPTQELVDAFEMQNGKPVTDAASGYDPAHPYDNRDPRFYSTILYNGAQWLKRPVETFEGGLDKPNQNIVQTQTGYYMRKFMGSFTSSASYSAQNHNFVLFRYADVLLWYAEALNEYQGPAPEVYTAIEAVRKRAGLNPYKLTAGLTRDEMRDVIRHERRVEFAFEEQRFWDIRRWKIAADVLNGSLSGVKITRNSDSTFSYERTAVEKTIFPAPKMYLYPIPYSETSKDRSLIQNSGW